jgi:DNA-binding PadR family transcriptional regulator
MHPYEMATTMRERGKDSSIKLNYGALYTVVEALQKHGLIVAQETERAGRRPERTVYRLTDAGRMELIDWISELLSRPVKEYTQFEAGISLIPALPPEDAAALLVQRCDFLEIEITQRRVLLEHAAQRNVVRLNLIEVEYQLTMLEAELNWTRKLAEEIRSRTLEGITEWSAYHSAAAEQEHNVSQEKAEKDSNDENEN